MGGSTRPCWCVRPYGATSEAARKLSVTAFWQLQAWQDASGHQRQKHSITPAVMLCVALDVSGHLSCENQRNIIADMMMHE